MKTNTKNALIAIILVLIIGLSGLLFVAYNSDALKSSSLPKSKMLDLPLISAEVKSKDGENHSVDTYISLEFTEDTQDIDSGRLKQIVKDAVSSLEFEKITEPGNISYIKDEVMDKLGEYVPDDQLVGVYVTELQTGEYRVTGSTPPPTTEIESRNDVAKSLFSNLIK